jgi:hypothetical protein
MQRVSFLGYVVTP